MLVPHSRTGVLALVAFARSNGERNPKVCWCLTSALRMSRLIVTSSRWKAMVWISIVGTTPVADIRQTSWRWQIFEQSRLAGITGWKLQAQLQTQRAKMPYLVQNSSGRSCAKLCFVQVRQFSRFQCGTAVSPSRRVAYHRRATCCRSFCGGSDKKTRQVWSSCFHSTVRSSAR